MIFSDKNLSQKLERTEARANADFVETRARLNPEYGAEWIEVAGTYAMFDGVESPLTQTFGLGMFEETTPAHLDEIETFFKKHDAPVFHEVSPMSDMSLLSLLADRGYRPIEMTSVMYRELSPENTDTAEDGSNLFTRVITPGEEDLWATISAGGWATVHESLADFMLAFGRINTQCVGSHPYLAELEGEPIAAGMLFIYDDVCILAGASTIPDGRNRGAQTALLRDRLRSAAESGCTLAIMGALPGSQSQRNAQKNGFNIAYTRAKWQLMK